MCAVYTKQGDFGMTDLANGERVAKNEIRVEICGTLDELSSFLGLVLTETVPDSTRTLLVDVQKKLMLIAGEISMVMTESKITENDLRELETTIDRIESQLPVLNTFILPGGVRSAAYLHVARTVCRRLERHFVSMWSPKAIQAHLAYLNRLSDLLFVLARLEQEKP